MLPGLDTAGGPAIPETFSLPKIFMIIIPLLGAAGYSLIYMIGGGGLFGALVIFLIAKMIGK